MIPTAFFCCISLFGFYEGRVEAERIKGIAFEIQGQAPVKKQFVEGSFSNEPVWFSIAKRPMSINYAIKVNSQKAIEQKPRLEQYIMSELSAVGVKGFRILITEDSVILTKLFMIAFQIVPEKTAHIYSTLVRAKRDLLS
jgi:tRNA G26 N,N-dimethylase Trm1